MLALRQRAYFACHEALFAELLEAVISRRHHERFTAVAWPIACRSSSYRYASIDVDFHTATLRFCRSLIFLIDFRRDFAMPYTCRNCISVFIFIFAYFYFAVSSFSCLTRLYFFLF